MILATGIVSVVALVGVLLLFPRRAEPPEPVPQIPPEPAIQVEGVEGLVLKREGRKVWELYVDRVTLTKDETKAWATGVRKAIYYGPDGKKVMTVSADSLTYDGVSGEVVLSGRIKLAAVLPKNRVLKGQAGQAIWREGSQRLEVLSAIGEVDQTRFLFPRGVYFPEQEVVECTGGVVLTSPSAQVTCASLRGNVDRNHYFVNPPVLIQAYLNGGAPTMPLQPVAFQPPAQGNQKKPAEPPEKKEPLKEKKKREIIFQTDQQVIAKERKWFIRDAVITEKGEDYQVQVKRAVYDERNERVDIEDGVRFEDPETLATAPKGSVDMRNRVATFEGPVKVVVKPKKEEPAPEKKEDKRPAPPPPAASGKKDPAVQKNSQGSSPVGGQPNPLESTPKDATAPQGKNQEPKEQKKEEPKAEEKETYRERVRRRGGEIVCERAQYYYRERRVEAAGKVNFKQEDRYEGSSEKATYLVRDEILTLEGQVIIRDLKKGHRFECPKVVINLKTDEIEVTPPVKGLFIMEEEEEKKEEPKKEEKAKPEEKKPAEPTPEKKPATPEKPEAPEPETPPAQGEGVQA
ncbi:MAG: hypothetical protein NZ959_12320 [Armatimonadetes bacterium]|nr:hypothetical protein [Armatimonadota bacterium]MDW8123084.1 hypothetical protein [Armatimonadota bacterium]